MNGKGSETESDDEFTASKFKDIILKAQFDEDELADYLTETPDPIQAERNKKVRDFLLFEKALEDPRRGREDIEEEYSKKAH